MREEAGGLFPSVLVSGMGSGVEVFWGGGAGVFSSPTTARKTHHHKTHCTTWAPTAKQQQQQQIKRFIILLRDPARPNSELLVAPVSDPSRARPLVRHRASAQLEGASLGARHLVLQERANASTRLVVHALPAGGGAPGGEFGPGDGEVISFDEAVYDLGGGEVFGVKFSTVAIVATAAWRRATGGMQVAAAAAATTTTTTTTTTPAQPHHNHNTTTTPRQPRRNKQKQKASPAVGTARCSASPTTP